MAVIPSARKGPHQDSGSHQVVCRPIARSWGPSTPSAEADRNSAHLGMTKRDLALYAFYNIYIGNTRGGFGAASKNRTGPAGIFGAVLFEGPNKVGVARSGGPKIIQILKFP